MTDPLAALTALICEHSGLTGVRAERLARRIVTEWLPAQGGTRVVDREALAETLDDLISERGVTLDDERLDWLAAFVADHAAQVRADVRLQVAEEWIERLAPLCDDDWLRRRDRCMGLPGASHRHERSAASAWENAARMIRQALNEHGYEDKYVERHASYQAWLNKGRDEPRAAVDGGEHD